MQIDQIVNYLMQYGVWAVYAVLFAIIFAESGLLIGFFLPGDSLLFTVGFLASQGILNEYILVPVLFIAAVGGDTVGYWFGHKVGKQLFHRKDSVIFHKDNLLKARAFYNKYGKKTIILARFLPVVRTFAPIVAGIGDMHYSTFLAYNVVGGLLWAVGLTLAGFFLGSLIPDVDRYLLPIILAIVVFSVVPTALHILRHKQDRDKIMDMIKKFLCRSK